MKHRLNKFQRVFILFMIAIIGSSNFSSISSQQFSGSIGVEKGDKLTYRINKLPIKWKDGYVLDYEVKPIDDYDADAEELILVEGDTFTLIISSFYDSIGTIDEAYKILYELENGEIYRSVRDWYVYSTFGVWAIHNEWDVWEANFRNRAFGTMMCDQLDITNSELLFTVECDHDPPMDFIRTIDTIEYDKDWGVLHKKNSKPFEDMSDEFEIELLDKERQNENTIKDRSTDSNLDFSISFLSVTLGLILLTKFVKRRIESIYHHY